MVTTVTHTVNLHITRLAVLIAVLVSSLVAAAPAPAAAAPASTTAGCYASATGITRSFTGGTWTGWYSRTATASCADLNVAIMNHPSNCYVFVDAQYYSPTYGRWIDGAGDDFWMTPGYWYTPLTQVRDGTSMAVRFYTQCSDSSAVLWLAS